MSELELKLTVKRVKMIGLQRDSCDNEEIASERESIILIECLHI